MSLSALRYSFSALASLIFLVPTFPIAVSLQPEDWFALTLALSPGRERTGLCARLAPLNLPASGARDVPARSGSECNRRLGEGSGTSRLSEPLRPGTGRAPNEGSWAGRSGRAPLDDSPACDSSLRGGRKSPLPGERDRVRANHPTAPWANVPCPVGAFEFLLVALTSSVCLATLTA